MPSKADTQVNNFVGGLITEASPLSFPPNVSFDESNFKLLRDGSRERRLGLDTEGGGALIPSGLTEAQLASAKLTFFEWPNASGSINVRVGVIQIANKLFFLNTFAEAPSAAVLNGGSAITLDMPMDINVDLALHNDSLVVASESLRGVLFFDYDDVTDVVTSVSRELKIRDLYGVVDDLEQDNRPATLSDKHDYNLKNQGWNDIIESTCSTNAIQCTKNIKGVYPSNSDQWSFGKIADVASADVDKFDPVTMFRNSINLGLAPRGHFIIDLYDRGFGRTTASGVGGLNVDREIGRVSTLASYAGRMFYSGIKGEVLGRDDRSPKFTGVVFFSQIADTDENVTKCYQEADPTSQESPDIIATDGGVIQIPGVAQVIRLFPLKKSLFVFATNGVWEIKGDDAGFSANAFQVNKITSDSVFSKYSIVEANNSLFFWGESGIFSLSIDSVGVDFATTNITLTNIQKLYNSLPDLIKRGAKAFYDAKNNQIRWLYKSDVNKIPGIPIELQPTVPISAIGTEAFTGESSDSFVTIGLTASKYVIAFRELFTGKFSILVVNVTGSTTIAVEPVQEFYTVGGTSTLPTIVKISDSEFMVENAYSSGSRHLSIFTVDNSDVVTLSDMTPAIGAGETVGGMAYTTGGAAVIATRVIATSAIKYYPVDVTSGTAVLGTPLTAADPQANVPILISNGTNKVISYNELVAINVNVTTTAITEDPVQLDTTPITFQGGGLSGTRIADTSKFWIGNKLQGGFVTSTLGWRGNTNGDVSAITMASGGATSVKDNLISVISTVSNGLGNVNAIRFSEYEDQGPDPTENNVVLTRAATVLLDDDSTRMNSIIPAQLDVATSKFFWVGKHINNSEIVTQVIATGGD